MLMAYLVSGNHNKINITFFDRDGPLVFTMVVNLFSQYIVLCIFKIGCVSNMWNNACLLIGVAG